MWSYSIIFGALIELVILKAAKTDIPGCHFLDTVNISSSQRLQNGSYIYLDVKIPVNFTGQYFYITTEKEVTELVRSHLRGCVCHLKPCIWICCRFKDWDVANNKCNDDLMEELSEINPLLKVTLSNGSVVNRNLLKDFIVLRDRMQFNDFWREDKYKLFENGSILLNSSKSMNFRGYDCIHPNQFTLGKSEAFVVAFHTTLYFERLQLNLPGSTELMWLSEVFLVLTIAVYLYLSKLRNLHGKCFICYMITNIIYFTNYMLNGVQIDSELCVIFGYLMNFFTISKFNWLFVIGHQLWRGFTSVNRTESEYSFGAYSILAWGTPAFLTGVVFLIDQIWDDDPSRIDWVSGVGWEICDVRDNWLNTVFLSLPLVIAVVLNTILFILTTISIIRVRLSIRHFSEQVEPTRKNLNSKMAKYYVFLRLFILLDIQWSVRIFFFFIHWKLLLVIFQYCDLCNGLIIFLMFVLKRSTLKLLMDNFRKRENKS